MRAPTPEERKAMYWRSNKAWYRFDKEKNCYELTDEAPEEAKDSFELDRKMMERRLKEMRRLK